MTERVQALRTRRFGITYEGKADEYHITVTADGYLDGELFLGKLAAKQNLSGVVVKLARATGEKAKEETTLVTGVVTRGRKAVGGGMSAGGKGAGRRRIGSMSRSTGAERSRSGATNSLEH